MLRRFLGSGKSERFCAGISPPHPSYVGAQAPPPEPTYPVNLQTGFPPNGF